MRYRQRIRSEGDRRSALESLPALREGVETRPWGDDGLVLHAAVAPGRAGWLDRFRPRVESRRYELDAFGAFVVKQMDGRNSVVEIVNRFQAAFGMSRRESELGVVAFVKMLLKRGLLNVTAPDAEPVAFRKEAS